MLNQDDEAKRRNEIRGQTVPSSRSSGWDELTEFRGDHLVECCVMKDGVVVARACINVSISVNSQETSPLVFEIHQVVSLLSDGCEGPTPRSDEEPQ